MISIDTVFEDVRFLVRKERGAFITADEFNTKLDMGQRAVHATMAQDELQNQVTYTALDPFRKRWEFNADSFTDQFLNLPDDHVFTTSIQKRYWDNVKKKGAFKGVQLFKTDEWDDACNSQVVPATENSPVATSHSKTQIEFYPEAKYAGVLRYLRMPVVAKWVSTISNGNQVYDSINSIQLEWADPFINTIILKTLSLFGVHLSAADLVQYAEGKLDKSVNSKNKE